MIDFERFARCQATVIGDLMLDCYLQGEASRISPEAPVLIVRAMSEKSVAGGAANVAANVASLGLFVRVVGLTGADGARDTLLERLCQHGRFDLAGVIAVRGRPTTKKLRVLGAHQQIIRIDEENTDSFDDVTEARLIEAAFAAIEPADVVILSDYGKGALSDHVLQAVIGKCNALGKTLLVDPKRLDLSAYRGATILTPNRKELTASTALPCDSDAEAALAARRASEVSGADILLTRSEKGMSFFSASHEPIHLATVAQDVFDVSGAGDTVIAALAASIAADMPIGEAMKMANHAAGIVVAKVGTAVVTLDELRASVAAETVIDLVNDGRQLTRSEIVALRWAWAREKLTVGFANGCFDLLHPGHVSLIRQASDSCDRLIMALNSDASVRRLKGPTRPVQNENARAAVIGGMKGVAAVVIFDEDTPLDLIQALQPDILVKGADYTEDKVVGADFVRARGGRIVLANLSPGHSTTRIIKAAERPQGLKAQA